MKASKRRDASTLAARLETEYKMLQRILERRAVEKKPNLGKSVEERINSRTLEELEE